jgi:hypothetical protein
MPSKSLQNSTGVSKFFHSIHECESLDILICWHFQRQNVKERKVVKQMNFESTRLRLTEIKPVLMEDEQEMGM